MQIRIFLSLVAFYFIWVWPAFAASLALVGNDEGHAVLVQHRGNCYAIMPNHVAARDQLALTSALPQKTGTALVFHRKREMDLALAYVEGDIVSTCDRSWNELAADVSELIAGSTSGGLKRIQFAGKFMDRAEATIVDADDNHFEIVTSEQWASSEIMGGVSGTLFFVNDQPVGIALSSENTNRARFLRLDRVFEALSGVLSAGRSTHPARMQITGSTEGLGYRITSQMRLKNGAKKGLANALTADWDGAEIEIEFTLSNDLPVRLDQILLESDIADSAQTFPQKIVLELDRGRPGNPFWGELFTPDMPPSGKLDINTGETFARRVRLTIQSVWHSDRPMRIDRVVFR
ncbi:MAG: hypothetical protein ACRBBQ_16275 [Cognatishimia sp.]